MAELAVVPVTPETVSGLSRRLAELLEQSESEGTQGQLPDATREQAAGLVEVLRRRNFQRVTFNRRSQGPAISSGARLDSFARRS